MEFIIGLLILFGVVYFLQKKGIVKHLKFPTVHNNIVIKRDMNRKLTMSYKTFNGIEDYLFFTKQARPYTLNYDVKVQAGSLILKCAKGKEVLFEKEFTQDEQGSFSFTAKHNRYHLFVIGTYTQGGCDVTFIPQSTEAINEL
ncbi:hypothetical protein ACTNEO_09795 [Gracilibacillus sp. HCP3S3_G5_1]|uniref:hypothetical protein n=1 Tax=Gracilibacillus sp. HCP3S3_G5_1 TaxID=3438940 RepID=UPI003F8B10AB